MHATELRDGDYVYRQGDSGAPLPHRVCVFDSSVLSVSLSLSRREQGGHCFRLGPGMPQHSKIDGH